MITEKILPNKTSLIFFILIIGFFNYMFFIKPKNFLNYGFKTDKKGGFTIVGFLIIIVICFVFFANKSRDKIFKEREKHIPPPVISQIRICNNLET
jgi:RsiW-degrading membrane proteinase PrsW (M82 family)